MIYSSEGISIKQSRSSTALMLRLFGQNGGLFHSQLQLSSKLFLCLFCLCFTLVKYRGQAEATPSKSVEDLQTRRLAVLDFRDEASLPIFERAALADSVRGAALNTPLMVMTKENMVALLPPNTDLASCVDDCEVEVGRSIGAHYIITGMIGRVDERLQLLLRLYETRSGSLRGQSTLSAQSVGALQPKVRRAALEMLTELSPSLQQMNHEQRTLLLVRLRPENAEVLLDGYKIPKARRRQIDGGFLIPIKPGKHSVSAKARGYLSQQVTLKVREGEPVEADLRLKPRGQAEACYSGHCQADVFVFTKPPNAKIYVDGVDTGISSKPSSMNPKLGSAAIRVSPGKHWISAHRAPFDEATRMIEVKAGDLFNGFRDAPLTLQRARGQLSVKSEPSGAIVRLNGEIVGKTPLTKRQVLARPYWIELIAEGYQSREELITVERGRTQKINWRLTSSTAELELTVSYKTLPVVGASIWLDDQKIGETNEEGTLSLDRVITGDHHLQVKHPLYTAEGESISLHPGRKTKRRFRMHGAFAYLSVDTSALKSSLEQWRAQGKLEGESTESEKLVILWGGAKLDFDSQPGSEQKIRVSAGRRWLQVRPPSGAETVFAPSSQQIDLRAGDHVTVTPVWKRHLSSLTLGSRDTKSEVLIDGERIGWTPIKHSLETGPHTIELRTEGHAPYRKLIWLTKKGLSTDVNFEERTTLAVSCAPIQGIIDIDGLALGPSPQTVDVKPGSHLVSCLAKGAEVHRRVELSPGQQLIEQLTISDELLGEAYKTRRMWRRGAIATSVGSALLIAGGLTSLVTALPKALEDRNAAQDAWILALDPSQRAAYAQSWSEKDTEAKNLHLMGWGITSLGLSLGISSAIAWWYHQE